jgi:hypothetical protein
MAARPAREKGESVMAFSVAAAASTIQQGVATAQGVAGAAGQVVTSLSGGAASGPPILPGGTLSAQELVDLNGDISGLNAAQVQELITIGNKGALGTVPQSFWTTALSPTGNPYACAMATVNAAFEHTQTKPTIVPITSSSILGLRMTAATSDYGAGDVPENIPPLVQNAAATEEASTTGLGTYLLLGAGVVAGVFMWKRRKKAA